MFNIHSTIATNLSSYRLETNLSLDDVSKMTGVSKNMLAQIEKGNSNPTINTLSKIANGLHIPLSQLVTYSMDAVTQVHPDDITAIYNKDQTVVVYPYFPYNPETHFEMFNMTIAPHSQMVSEGHFKGSEEYIIVTRGQINMEMNNQIYTVKANHAIHFVSDIPHTYHNPTDQEASLIATIQYKSS
ncbi:helix-turn-helix domain-containing protein [Staphylococcus canis]|uniref:Helix-turn-helix domain-containing protein n=1 Tax=Staphylococcus canis TaxID=2724942 RepID=A0ABS0T8Q0_9STAP|nr:helix-turn-helix domain-containing protein [Staphylococcus canis]